MRLLLVALLAAGCHAGGGEPPPLPGGLILRLELPAPAQPGEVAIASAMLHFSKVTAVSDRAAADPRAAAVDVALALGGAAEVALPTAPPGLYAAVDAQLGGAGDLALDVQGVWRSERVHATAASLPFDVGCASPVRVAPGGQARLTLRADPTVWFAGIDLGRAARDADDAGIVVSDDDNPALLDAVAANVRASFALDCAPE